MVLETHSATAAFNLNHAEEASAEESCHTAHRYDALTLIWNYTAEVDEHQSDADQMHERCAGIWVPLFATDTVLCPQGHYNNLCSACRSTAQSSELQRWRTIRPCIAGLVTREVSCQDKLYSAEMEPMQ